MESVKYEAADGRVVAVQVTGLMWDLFFDGYRLDGWVEDLSEVADALQDHFEYNPASGSEIDPYAVQVELMQQASRAERREQDALREGVRKMASNADHETLVAKFAEAAVRLHRGEGTVQEQKAAGEYDVLRREILLRLEG